MNRYQRRRDLQARICAAISFTGSLSLLSFGILAIAYTGTIDGGIFAAIACISAIIATVSGFAARS